MGLFSKNEDKDETTAQEQLRLHRKNEMRFVTINRRIDRLENKITRLDEDMDEVFDSLGLEDDEEEEEEKGGEDE